MVVAERLELAVGPRIQNPVLRIDKRVLGLVFGLSPDRLDLRDQLILVLLSVVLRFDALELEVRSKLVYVPAVVRLDNMVVPVLLDAIVQVLAVCRRWVRDVVI